MNSNNELQLILNEASNYPVLEAQEQLTLVAQAQAGNSSAKDKLVMSNVLFVISFVSKYKNNNIETSELLAEGMLGLVEAIDKFDSSKKVSFISYASFWIRHHVERIIQQSSQSIRLPMNKIRLVHQMKKEEEQLRKQAVNSEEDILTHLSKNLQISKSQIQELQQISIDTLSLNQAVNTNNTTTSFIDGLADLNNENIDDSVEYNNEAELLSHFIEKIPNREAAILKERYGWNGAPQSLSTLSKKYHISKERVRQLEMKGIKRIKALKEHYENVSTKTGALVA